MATQSIPVTELRGLLAAVSDHGMQHLLEVEADLMQTTYLLSEAIEKLSASFLAVHEAVVLQQEEIDALLEVHDLPQEAIDKIGKYRAKIGEEVDLVITGLQFQDLTSQLIARTIRRVNGLKDTLIALGEHGDVMDPEHEHEEIARLLEEMSANLTTSSNALSSGLRRAVDQKNMSSGEIELF